MSGALTDTSILAGASGVVADTRDKSCRFDEDRDTKLSRTFLSTGNRKTWTVSAWVKRAAPVLDTTDHGEIFLGYTASTNAGFTVIYFYNGSFGVAGVSGGGWKWTTALYRDPSAWYHLVVVFDTTESVATDRCKIYVNGSRVTAWATDNTLTENGDYGIGGAWLHEIGHDHSISSTRAMSGYIAEFYYIDGTAYDADDFGELDSATNQWIPIDGDTVIDAVTFGTNGFYQNYSDSSALGDDSSGNGNDFTATNLVATDQMLDAPTNNFCTLNPLFIQTGANNHTLSEGNLQIDITSDDYMYATLGVASGKWYWECYVKTITGTYGWIGVVDASKAGAPQSTIAGSFYESNHSGGRIKVNGTYEQTSVGTVANGDIVGVALDMDASPPTVAYYKNNSQLGSTEDLTTDITYTAFNGSENSGATKAYVYNFGSDSSFAANKTAQGNSDGNDIGDFYYAPPTDFLALCTNNLPDPSIALPGDYYNTVLYTGTGSNPNAITGVGFQPDFVWTKARTKSGGNGGNPWVTDAIRGIYKELRTDSSALEGTDYNGVVAFGADGFSVGTGGFNQSGDPFVGWCWKANGSGSANTDGSISSTVSASPTSGFSIVTYTGTGAIGTVGHGLGQAPEVMIVKKYSGGAVTDQWRMFNENVGNTYAISFSEPDVFSTSSSWWNDTSPTASVFTLGSGEGVNHSSYSFIAYCFHSVEDYSKFGEYEGNNSTDGAFINTGFKPAYFMCKAVSDTTNWNITSGKILGYNQLEKSLISNSNVDEELSAGKMDFVSNGVKMRNNNTGRNSAQTYIYLAFAEAPFKTSNAG